MNIRPAQHAASRGIARALAATFLAAACLAASASAASAAPTVVIGGVPPLNQTSGTFSFSVTGAVQKVECSLDGSGYSDCVSPVPVSGLSVSPPTHTFSVRATGTDLSIGTASYSWTIDMDRPAVPVLSSPPNNLLTNLATPTFSGTAEAGTRVAIFDGTDQIGNPLVGNDTHWEFTPPAALADGTHLWRARAVDPAGNRSDYTALRTLKIDTQAPGAPVIDAPAASARVNKRNPVFSGTAEALATVAVSEGATRLCTTAADPNGAWSCISNVALADGHHAVSAFARDGAGNESGETAREFDLDATPPPAPAITTPTQDVYTTATSVTIWGTAEALTPVKILVGANEVAEVLSSGDGNWSHTFSNLAEGDYAISAKEVDDYGNRSAASNVINVHVDRTAPRVTVSGHPPLQTNETDAEFVLTADEPNVTLDCALDGSGWQPCSDHSTFSGLSEAVHNFKARATDRTGNVGEESDVFSWRVDLTDPDPATLVLPGEGAILTTARPAFSGQAEAGADVEVIDEFTGSLGRTTADQATGAWSFTPGSNMGEGQHTVRAVTIDPAGNRALPSNLRHVTIDTVAPVTTLGGVPSGPTSADSVAVSFTADDPQASFSCSLDGSAFSACTSPASTGYVAEGTHTLRVRARDAAGNTENPARTATIVFDRTAPAGSSHLIPGSAGADGVPVFAIASDDPAASSKCKLDNGAFVNCSGTYKPAGASSGLHALTIRYGDAAGNQSDQVIAFNVVPASAPTTGQTTDSGGNQPAPSQPACRVAGGAGSIARSLAIGSVSGTGRALRIKLTAGAAGIARADVSGDAGSLAQAPFAIKRAANTLAVQLKRVPTAGSGLTLAVRFYSVKREFATARLALTASASGVSRALGATSELDTACPAATGPSAGARLSVTQAAGGARSFRLDSNGRRPALIALKVFRAGSNTPLADLVIAAPAGKQRFVIKLSRPARLVRGGYRFTYDSFSAGGVGASGRGAFLAR